MFSAFLSQKVKNKLLKFLLWIIFIGSVASWIAAGIMMEIDNNKRREADNKKIDRIIESYNNFVGMWNTSTLPKQSLVISRNEDKSDIKKSHPENEELKIRANQLSKEMLEFIVVRQQYAPRIPNNQEEWNRDVEKIHSYFKETMSQYSLRFNTRVIAMRNELADKGLKDDSLDSVFDKPGNAMSIRFIAEGIKALANQLP